jgi:hypothetical protein
VKGSKLVRIFWPRKLETDKATDFLKKEKLKSSKMISISYVDYIGKFDVKTPEAAGNKTFTQR